jgi:predicted  nucleic acid-binding Zn-ribbon protein
VSDRATAGEVTRANLRRALVVNALTKPVNLAVPTVVLVVAVAIETWWLAAVAVVVYVGLAVVTFFDEDEAREVGDREYGRRRLGSSARRVDPAALAAPIAAPLSAALDEEARIRRSVEQTQLPFDELTGEVSQLVEAMGRTAQRAQRIHDYLSGQHPESIRRRIEELRRSKSASDQAVQRTIAALLEQLRAHGSMSRQLERFHAEMEQTVASLSTIHARVVQMGVASEAAGEHELADQVRDLRDQVAALSAGMSEAYAVGESPQA